MRCSLLTDLTFNLEEDESQLVHDQNSEGVD